MLFVDRMVAKQYRSFRELLSIRVRSPSSPSGVDAFDEYLYWRHDQANRASLPSSVKRG